MRGELSLALAPTGPVIPGHPASPASLAAAPGDPVALLLPCRQSASATWWWSRKQPENLTAGPGHLRDTPLPGQGGVSVVFGRRATFGAPFERLPQLAKGDTIATTSSQGVANYQVIAVSDSSKPSHSASPEPAAAGNRELAGSAPHTASRSRRSW